MTYFHKKYLVAVNLMAFVLFVLMLLSVLNQSAFLVLDEWISMHIPHIRMQWLDPLVVWVTDMNGIKGAVLFSVFVTGVFIWKRWYSDIWFYLVVSLGATGLFAGIKSLVERTRPDISIIEVGGFSFPSGHTTMATAMAFSLYFILSDKTDKREVRAALFIMALGWSLIIASTRIYLGVHWFSDVVGGFGLGLWWVTLVKLVWGARKTS